MQPPSPRTRVRRKPDRADYDRSAIDAILDEALICHVGFVRDGAPVVIPTIHARRGDVLYLHASNAAGLARDLGDGRELCVTVSIVDALVVARSANHHSMNYRSVMVYGRGTLVTDRAEKMQAFEAIVDHVVPGRWSSLRPVNDQELRETSVLRVMIEEASAKIRTGPPIDPDDDRALPIWAGVLPLRLQPGVPVPDEGVDGLPVPDHVTRWTRRGDPAPP